jgi:hypothetical protein
VVTQYLVAIVGGMVASVGVVVGVVLAPRFSNQWDSRRTALGLSGQVTEQMTNLVQPLADDKRDKWMWFCHELLSVLVQMRVAVQGSPRRTRMRAVPEVDKLLILWQAELRRIDLNGPGISPVDADVLMDAIYRVNKSLGQEAPNGRDISDEVNWYAMNGLDRPYEGER